MTTPLTEDQALALALRSVQGTHSWWSWMSMFTAVSTAVLTGSALMGDKTLLFATMGWVLLSTCAALLLAPRMLRLYPRPSWISEVRRPANLTPLPVLRRCSPA
ncbi:hypothetical protein [Deinococcus sp. QL22]|uniref:hypothetical protein n=1 Tax=Deinococcus sp. QL22 TaxID=2939437 RepID=UPI002018144E|nr:hypothetical protein [Deinococcus sp. QL22]UQN08845.1 hypothetical protein M1R55_19820 [Deinococcus sp. QL22]